MKFEAIIQRGADTTTEEQFFFEADDIASGADLLRLRLTNGYEIKYFAPSQKSQAHIDALAEVKRLHAVIDNARKQVITLGQHCVVSSSHPQRFPFADLLDLLSNK